MPDDVRDGEAAPCGVAGTAAAEKVRESTAGEPLHVGLHGHIEGGTEAALQAQQTVFESRRTDPLENLGFAKVLARFPKPTILAYGAMAEGTLAETCRRLAMLGHDIAVVVDAVGGLPPEKRTGALSDLAGAGVRMLGIEDAISLLRFHSASPREGGLL
jgi:hypothetical protein